MINKTYKFKHYITFSILFILLLFLNCTFSLENNYNEDPHYINAKKLYFEIFSETLDDNYIHPDYDKLIEELSKVPKNSVSYKQSHEWILEINAKRNEKKNMDFFIEASIDSSMKEDSKKYKELSQKKDIQSQIKVGTFTPKSSNKKKDHKKKKSNLISKLDKALKVSRKAGFKPSNPIKKVTLYGAAWCGSCNRARKYFDKNKIRYIYKNVDIPSIKNDLKRARKKHKINGNSIPLIIIGKKAFVGFSKNSINEALK